MASSAAPLPVFDAAVDSTPLMSQSEQDEQQQEQHSLVQQEGTSRTIARKYSRAAIVLIFAVPGLGGLLFGFDISSTSYAIVQQTESSILVANHATLQGWIVSASSLGALLGSFAIFYYNIADVIGRRKELQYGALLYLIGAILEVVAASFWNEMIAISLVILSTGRILYGVGIAFAMHGGPTYLAEMTPSSVRGLCVSLKEASIVLGILAGYVVGYYNSKTENGWLYTYGSSTLISLLMWLITFGIPRSSRWLLLVGNDDEALKSMKVIYPDPQDAQFEFDAMKQQHEDSTIDTNTCERLENTEQQNLVASETNATDDTSLLKNSYYRAPLIAGIGLVVLQQITGQPSVLSYATPILMNAGLSGSASILLALFKLVATLTAAATVEKFGRKKLLYIGNSLMLFALIILTVSFDSNDSQQNSKETSDSASINKPYIILLALFLYIGGYQFSFGPISWLMISEVFPLNVRGKAVALAVQINFLCNALVQFLVPVLERLIGLNITFGIFACLTGYSLYFVKSSVLETKGLTLEQIEQQFRRQQ